MKKETIDRAAEDFGMPMGPIELADQVGLDICLHVAEMLKSGLNRDMPDPPQWLKDKVAKGELGKKTGKGFYDWKDGHAVKESGAPPPPSDTIDRLILPMLDVCVACLREGVVADEEIVDGAMIFATGFAPFRGGPMHYARTRGIDPTCATRWRSSPRPMARGSGPTRAGTTSNEPGQRRPASFSDAGRLADAIVERVGKTIVLALPLGLGKANHIANALYALGRRRPLDQAHHLHRADARAAARQERAGAPLSRSLHRPHLQGLPGARLRQPRSMPARCRRNITVNEFFFEAGQWLGSPYAQQHYISANYTHALRAVLDRGVNVVAQLVAHDDSETPRPYSLSCNPDLTLDLLAMRRDGKVNFLFAGQVNSELPFMPDDAAIAADELDLLLDGPATDFPLFAPPREPVALADYAAGLHAAALIPDGGTLQIGIGSLGDAVAQALVLRHRRSGEFRNLLTKLGADAAAAQTAPFATGLYGCTELFVDGLLDLFNAGILKREVDGAVLHAGFFLGSRAFQRALREMPREIRGKFRMTSINYVNELYGGEEQKRQARTGARFINDAMMATLLGDVGLRRLGGWPDRQRRRWPI